MDGTHHIIFIPYPSSSLVAAILELGLVIGFGAISNRVKISVADKMGHLIMEGS